MTEANKSELTSITENTDCVMSDEELNGITGGGRTNGDNPIVQTVILAAKETFYQGMWYASQGWKS
jgi:bacteriocin-like protein